MGVECELVGLIGLKLDYFKYAVYESKKDPDYMEDLADGRLENKICIFKDYFPDNFIVKSDVMCGEYIYVGFKIFETQYMDIGIYMSTGPEELQKQIDLIKPEFDFLQIKYNKNDIKLHIFTHFW
jgi:hypothetical protein